MKAFFSFLALVGFLLAACNRPKEEVNTYDLLEMPEEISLLEWSIPERVLLEGEPLGEGESLFGEDLLLFEKRSYGEDLR